MDNFAFIIHPLDESDVARKFPMAQLMPKAVISHFLKLAPPFKASDITGVSSKHNQVDGWFLTCPLTAKQLLKLPQQWVIHKIIKTGRLAEKLGAKIVGLGAYTSVVGDAGITIAKNLNIPVTTGNSYTVSTAIEGTRRAAEVMGHTIAKGKIAVIGATGSIGAVCANLLAREASDLTLVGRDEAKLHKLASRILYDTGLVVKVTSNVVDGVKDADIVIVVTSATEVLINPQDLKIGAVVCDVSRPRNVSKQVAELRDDVLVIEGGFVEVPGDVNFNLNFGFPPKTSYACMAETMILALEQKYESYTLGRDLSVDQVLNIEKLAKKHGFRVGGFRSFEKALTDVDIMNIRSNADKKKLAAETA